MKNLDKHFSNFGYSDSIPIDLLIDIFLRVPAKSIARFRCVSKFWASILVRPDFTELFLTRSSTRPRLLFAFHSHGKLYFYSAPQPHNPDENSSIVATRYHNYSLRDDSSRLDPFELCPSLCGLVSPHGRQDGRKYQVTVICNPVTGESINLPNVDIKGRSFLGYDPIDKQYKVLFCSQDIMCDEYRVLTLETGKHLWRMIKCKPHCPNSRTWNMICINGFLYYRASFEGSSVIVCFDVRYEKFHFINMDKGMELDPSCTLFNYKGKLGAHQYTHWWNININLELWVLDDVGHKWSMHVYVLPPLYIQIIKKTMLHIVGMTDRGEVVLSQHYYQGGSSFCVFYYNLERNTLTKVDIQGLEESKYCYVHTFLDYQENVKLM